MLSLECRYSEISAWSMMNAEGSKQTQTNVQKKWTRRDPTSYASAPHTQDFSCAVCTVNLSLAPIPRGALVHGKLLFHSPLLLPKPLILTVPRTISSVLWRPLVIRGPCSHFSSSLAVYENSALRWSKLLTAVTNLPFKSGQGFFHKLL